MWIFNDFSVTRVRSRYYLAENREFDPSDKTEFQHSNKLLI